MRKTKKAKLAKAKITFDDKGLSPPMTVKELMELFGHDYDVLVMKWEIVAEIKAHCHEHKISQRKLASMVPGLTQDRVSDFYRLPTGGGITIDKLLKIASALDIKFKLVRAAA